MHDDEVICWSFSGRRKNMKDVISLQLFKDSLETHAALKNNRFVEK